MVRAYFLWLVAGKKEGDGFPGPLVLFGTWWLFLHGVALAILSLTGIFACVYTTLALFASPNLYLLWSTIAFFVEVPLVATMAYGALHNNKAYKLTASSSSVEARCRKAHKGGAKKRKENCRPIAKKY